MRAGDHPMIGTTPSEKTIFLKAIELTSSEERTAYLDAACRKNSALRAEIEALLLAHERPLGPLDIPDAVVGLGTIQDGPGTVIGPYKLLERIGEGGMGIVYSAEQTHPVRRTVALKIV